MRDLTVVVACGFIMLSGIMLHIVVPYIQQKTNQGEFERIKNWVKIAVQAAEMIYKESGMGAKKKEYVIKFLQDNGFTIDFELLDKMIESAVLEMNSKKGG